MTEAVDTKQDLWKEAERIAQRALDNAMLAFHKNPPGLAKNTQGYGYKYLSLPVAVAAIYPKLNEHGLYARWEMGSSPDNLHMRITCIVRHIEGGELRTSLVLPLAGERRGPPPGQEQQGKGKKDMRSPAQIAGSVLTYGRRYTLLACLGLVDEMDDDGAMGYQQAPQQAPQQAQQPTYPAPAAGLPQTQQAPPGALRGPEENAYAQQKGWGDRGAY